MINMHKPLDVKIKSKLLPAFTLAEVLITLVIIGVIAAITVPAMIQQTQKQEYVSGLKKAYSTLSNALYTMSVNSGYPHGDYTFLVNSEFMDEFAKIANVVKVCNTTAECFPSSFSSDSVYKNLKGQLEPGWSNGKAVITSDGYMYSSVKIWQSSTANVFGISDEDKSNALYRIIVDLNGWKKPNQWGYDTFWFYVIDGKGVVPAGITDTSNCKRNGDGKTCAAKVLKESKISY